MAGLDDINSSDPAGTETPTLGDNRIRALAAKTIEAFDTEHALAGPHTFLVGSAAQRPAAGYEGRFYILAAAGVAVELQYDTGSAWVSLTSNQAVLGYASGLAAHIAANPIDHPNESVTQIKIAQGAILKKHLDSSGDMTTLENLVNGGNADSFHVHSMTDQNIAVFTASGTWTCPAGVTLILFELWGGGGGGGSGDSAVGGGGGGAGGYEKAYYTVIPETDYTVVVGLGGSGGVNSGDGTSGGQTSFDGTIITYGGVHGGGSSTGSGGPGGGYTKGAGMPGWSGSNGGNVIDATRSGGYGGGSFGGEGGSPGIHDAPGSNGEIPGGGGGGAGDSDGHQYSGYSGARGLAILRW